jgi:hypothetical protein
MMRRFVLLVSALGCSDEFNPDCTHPLPPTDGDGNPWPTYSAAAAQIADCTQFERYYSRQRGACSDGKRFISKGGGFVGDTLYFDGEIVIGTIPWSDVSVCDATRFGDTRCEQTDVEEIRCPIGL